MSARQVMLNKLVCDATGCGAVYDHVATPVMHLREMAAIDGWRYRQQQVGGSNWLRSVDLCPKCPDAAELAESEHSRKTRSRR